MLYCDIVIVAVAVAFALSSAAVAAAAPHRQAAAIKMSAHASLPNSCNYRVASVLHSGCH